MDYAEVLEELKQIDEVTLLELLDITSEDLVDNFSEKITEHLNRIYKKLHE